MKNKSKELKMTMYDYGIIHKTREAINADMLYHMDNCPCSCGFSTMFNKKNKQFYLLVFVGTQTLEIPLFTYGDMESTKVDDAMDRVAEATGIPSIEDINIIVSYAQYTINSSGLVHDNMIKTNELLNDVKRGLMQRYVFVNNIVVDRITPEDIQRAIDDSIVLNTADYRFGISADDAYSRVWRPAERKNVCEILKRNNVYVM